jgi:hypothetical protein
MPRERTETEPTALRTWLASLSYNGLRALESSQPLTLPDGRRLRGIEFMPSLYLLRDRSWLAVQKRGDRVETWTLTDDAIVSLYGSVESVVARFRELCRERRLQRSA